MRSLVMILLLILISSLYLLSFFLSLVRSLLILSFQENIFGNHRSSVLISYFNFIDFISIFIISFPLLTLSFTCSSFSSFIKWKLRLLISDLFSFSIYAYFILFSCSLAKTKAFILVFIHFFQCRASPSFLGLTFHDRSKIPFCIWGSLSEVCWAAGIGISSMWQVSPQRQLCGLQVLWKGGRPGFQQIFMGVKETACFFIWLILLCALFWVCPSAYILTKA